MISFTTVFNEAGDWVEELIDGRVHTVVNGVGIAEGVWAGSEGPVYYSKEELQDSDSNWNYKPVVVKHPKNNQGQAISAAHPTVLNNVGVGFLLNVKTGADGKQRFRAYLDNVKADKVDKRIIANVKAGQKVEVSTGLEARLDKKAGDWNGKPWDYAARNLKPDHLAILLDEAGAYSVADGGGLLANSAAIKGVPADVQKHLQNTVAAWLKRSGIVANDGSLEQVKYKLIRLLASTYGEPGKEWYGFIEATFDDKVVFSGGGPDYGCMMVGYKETNDGVELVGDAVPVQSVYGYRSPDGTVLMANSSGIPKPVTEIDMDKKAHVTALIGNGQFAETDRTVLEAMDAAVLAKIVVVPKAAPAVTIPVVAAPSVPVANAAPVSLDGLLGQLQQTSPDMAYLLTNGLADINAKRDQLIATITNAPGNTFNPEYLKTRPIPELDGLAKLASGGRVSVQQVTNGGGVPMFLLNGVTGGAGRQPEVETPLIAPDLEEVPAKK